jgi:hypothetical protein
VEWSSPTVSFELDSVVTAFGYDYVPGNLADALALTRAGERASRIEIGYFLTRSGHGDELRYRSTPPDAFTLTTGARAAAGSARRRPDRPPGGPPRRDHQAGWASHPPARVHHRRPRRWRAAA